MTSTRTFKQLAERKYSESTVTLNFKKVVASAGGVCFKMHPVTSAGIPDWIVHVKGMTFYVELKATGKPCTSLQIEMHKVIHARGIQVYVLDTKVTNFYDIIQKAYTTYPGKHYAKNPNKDG